MSDITLINYTTRDFISKTELELYISKQDNIFTENVITEFKKAGMVRRVVTRIWNREGAFRVGILFENTDEKAYKNCQEIIAKEIMPKAMAHYSPKMRNNRGIVFYDYRS